MAAAAVTSTVAADSSSNQSHSSNRPGSNNNPNNSPSFQVHKPLSLADALSRAGGDVTSALDAVLADRNRLALEANKVNGENHRIWNLMGRIRKENDLLKGRQQGSGDPSSSISSNSLGHGSRGSPSTSSFNTVSSQPGQSNNLVNPQVPIRRRAAGAAGSQSDSPSLLGTSPSISSDSSSSAAVTPNFNPNGTPTSILMSSPSSSSQDASNDTMQMAGSSGTAISSTQPPVGMGISHSSTPPSSFGYGNQGTRSPLAIDSFARAPDAHLSDPPLSPSSAVSTASAQQSSIIQQRAAARARAQESMSQGGHGGGGDGSRSGHDHESHGREEVRDSMQSQDFEAVDGSEVDEEEGRDPRDDNLEGYSHPDGTRGVGAAALGVLSGNAESVAGTSTSDLSGLTPTATSFADPRASGPEGPSMTNGEALTGSTNGYGGSSSNEPNDNQAYARAASMESTRYQSNQDQSQNLKSQSLRHTPNSSASGAAFSPRSRPLQLSQPPHPQGHDQYNHNRSRSGSGAGASSTPGTPRRDREISGAGSNFGNQTPTTPNGTPRSMHAPRLDSQLLSCTRVKVVRSVFKSNERGREVVSFHIVVEVYSSPASLAAAIAAPEPEASSSTTPATPTTNQPQRKWSIDKLYSDVLALDARLRQKHGRSATKRINTAQLPDKTLFRDNAPSKVDMRKLILEAYLFNLLVIQLPDKDDLCTFLCTDVLPEKLSDPKTLSKEGFLTKKGQNLGRWVTRWYVLRGSKLDYYDTKNGAILGSVNIAGAQLGRQQRSSVVETDENAYRHAFLLLEKRIAGGPSTPSVSSVTSAAQSSSATGSGVSGDPQTVRHVLCAQSDAERDEWVDVLVRAVAEIDKAERKSQGHSSSIGGTEAGGRADQSQGRSKRSNSLSRRLRKDSKDTSSQSVVSSSREDPDSSGRSHKPTSSLAGSEQQQQPQYQPQLHQQQQQQQQNQSQQHQQQAYNDNGGLGMGIPPPGPSSPPPQARFGNMKISQDQSRPSLSAGQGERPTTPDGQSSTSSSGNRASVRPPISAPMNGTPIPTGYKFGAKDSEPAPDPSNSSGASNGSGTASGKKDVPDKKGFWAFRGFRGNDKAAARHEPRPVFGVPLAESIAISSIAEGLELPSVVFRCIEYLEKKEAAKEEGIYRLSGSTAVIKGLKDRFNNEGDVDLLAAEHEYDPHAIAGLLKTFLRELPTSVLTRELHLDFMRVNDIVDRRERVNELGQLACMLPLANYSLLRMLCSHLIKIIKNSDENKMTMRNVGIVFSPTLAIPAGVFALFLTEFDWVFYTDAAGGPAPKQIEEDILPPDEDELGASSRSQDDQASVLSPPLSSRSGGRNANRSSWMVGNNLHDGGAAKGSAPISFGQGQERNNRNSLQYNESEADKLLGLQGRRLSGTITENSGAQEEEYEEPTSGRHEGFNEDIRAQHHRRDLEGSVDEGADFGASLNEEDHHESQGFPHSLSGHEYPRGQDRSLGPPEGSAMAHSFSQDGSLTPQRFAQTPPISPGGRNLRPAPQPSSRSPAIRNHNLPDSTPSSSPTTATFPK